jgi:hypothetical protein
MSELLATIEVYSCWQSKRKEHDAGEEICRSEEKEILNTSVMHGARVKGLPVFPAWSLLNRLIGNVTCAQSARILRITPDDLPRNKILRNITSNMHKITISWAGYEKGAAFGSHEVQICIQSLYAQGMIPLF